MRPTPREIREIFESCLDADTQERKNILENAALRNQMLADEVTALLESHEILESQGTNLPGPQSDLFGAIVARGAAAAQAPASNETMAVMEPGHRVSDFVIIRKLGSGAFAHVYLATQLSLGRNVALKVSRLHTPEATMMAQLAHKNIVLVHSVFPISAIGAEAICMQYVPGVTLDELIRMIEAQYPVAHNSWSGAEVLSIIGSALGDTGVSLYKDQESRIAFSALNAAGVVMHFITGIARALAHAHEHEVLHLDVKPSNIIVDINGDARLMDFNVSFSRKANKGCLLGGTPDFMAPEHAAALLASHSSGNVVSVDERSDIYSLGNVGKRLFRLLPTNDESTGLGNILHQATTENPNERFKEAGLFAQACDDVRRMAALKEALDSSQKNFLYRLGKKHPRGATISALLVPNLIASVIQISYNEVHIIGKLSAEQSDVFSAILLPWNVLVFGWGCLMIWDFFRPFFSRCSPTAVQHCTFEERALVRKTLVRTPFLSAGLIAIGWSVACCVFLVALGVFSGPLSPNIAAHLVTSFALALAIPLAYSILSLGYLNLVVFYPAYLRALPDAGRVARQETATLRATMKAFRLVAGVVPLAGAIIGVAQGPGTDPASEYPYRAMVSAFIMTGIFGTWFAVTVVDSFMAAIKEIDSTYPQ